MAEPLGISYAARLSPLQAQTVWSLEKAELVERRGARERRLPLARLQRVTRAGRGATLQFQHRRLTIPAFSYGEHLRPEDHTDAFETFMTALAEAAPANPAGAPSANVEAALWIMVMIAVGAVAVLFAAGLAGAWLLGLALACRLVFVVILGAAALPWLHRKPSASRG